jgi:cytoskeletal protein RodZ
VVPHFIQKRSSEVKWWKTAYGIAIVGIVAVLLIILLVMAVASIRRKSQKNSFPVQKTELPVPPTPGSPQVVPTSSSKTQMEQPESHMNTANMSVHSQAGAVQGTELTVAEKGRDCSKVPLWDELE